MNNCIRCAYSLESSCLLHHYRQELLLVITCLGGQFGINSPSAFLTASNYKSASRQLQISGQLQNNTVNGAMSISINQVIQVVIVLKNAC